VPQGVSAKWEYLVVRLGRGSDSSDRRHNSPDSLQPRSPAVKRSSGETTTGVESEKEERCRR